MNELEMFRKFFEQAPAEVFAQFLAFVIKQGGPAATVAMETLNDVTARQTDLSLWEEVAGQAWEAQERREKEQNALHVALDALNHLLDGQEKHYRNFEYHAVVVTLAELARDNPALSVACVAIGKAAGLNRRPNRAKMEAARAAIIPLLDSDRPAPEPVKLDRRGLEIALACVEWKLNGGLLGFSYDDLALAEKTLSDLNDDCPISALLIVSGARRHRRNSTSRKRAEQARQYLTALLEA